MLILSQFWIFARWVFGFDPPVIDDGLHTETSEDGSNRWPGSQCVTGQVTGTGQKPVTSEPQAAGGTKPLRTL